MGGTRVDHPSLVLKMKPSLSQQMRTSQLRMKESAVSVVSPFMISLHGFVLTWSTLYRHARKLGVNLRSEDFRAKVMCGPALNLNMDAAERELPTLTILPSSGGRSLIGFP